MTDLVRTALPRTALLLAAWLTACGADHGDDKTGSTGAATGSSAGPDTGATGDAASTGAATDDAASTSAATGDAASTGEPADTCACLRAVAYASPLRRTPTRLRSARVKTGTEARYIEICIGTPPARRGERDCKPSIAHDGQS